MSDSNAWQASVQAAVRRFGRAIFGDRRGLVVFLSAVCFVTFSWRAGVFINDNFTLVRALDALSQGRVWLDTAGPDSFVAPGTSVRDGYVYGRNYGQVVLALPALWGLQAIDTVVNLHVALVAGWHLLALALVVQLGNVTEHERPVVLGGSGMVLGSFLLNATLVRTFTTVSLPLLALQLTTAVAAGLLAVFTYRLVARRHGARIGVYAGAGVVAATPIGLWATIPKRHVLSALLVVAVLYAFARSREGDLVTVAGIGPVPAYRAGAYALVGLLAWIHAAEGLFVFFALVLVDVPTAPANDRRTLAIVAGIFALSLVPLLLTNHFVTGEMLRPPRAMGDRGITAPAQENLTSPDSSGSGGGSGSPGWIETLTATLGAGPVGVILGQVFGITVSGFESLLDLDAVVQTYVASSVEAIRQNQTKFLGINLALLEAGPVLGASVGAVAGGAYAGIDRLRASLDATDVLAVAIGAAFVLVYNSRLPLNTQVTVRYLLVLYPLGVLLLARSETVRTLIEENRAELLWSYGTGVAIGGQLLLTYLVVGQYAVGEAARVHAWLGFVLGGAVAVVSAASVVAHRTKPLAAVAVGLAAAAGTVLFLLATLLHFAFIGEYVLPVAGALSDFLTAGG